MRRCRLTSAAVLSAAVLAGCVSHPPMAAPASPTPDELAAIKSSYTAVFPNARVGVVTAVLAGQPYALVGDIDTASVKADDVISFLDAKQTVVANGNVVKIDAGTLTVKFDAGQRRPVPGDAAVRF